MQRCNWFVARGGARCELGRTLAKSSSTQITNTNLFIKNCVIWIDVGSPRCTPQVGPSFFFLLLLCFSLKLVRWLTNSEFQVDSACVCPLLLLLFRARIVAGSILVLFCEGVKLLSRLCGAQWLFAINVSLAGRLMGPCTQTVRRKRVEHCHLTRHKNKRPENYFSPPYSNLDARDAGLELLLLLLLLQLIKKKDRHRICVWVI